MIFVYPNLCMQANNVICNILTCETSVELHSH